MLESAKCPLESILVLRLCPPLTTGLDHLMNEPINKSEEAIFADAVVPADPVRFSPLIPAAILHRQNLTKARMAYRDWVIGPLAAIQNIVCGPYARLFWPFA